jgi:hypothetical protein
MEAKSLYKESARRFAQKQRFGYARSARAADYHRALSRDAMDCSHRFVSAIQNLEI